MNCQNILRLFILSTCLSVTISGYAIGIDLGDHSSVISSVCKKGVRVLTNKIGGRSTPSVGVFLEKERLLGECTAGGIVTRNLQRAMTNPRKLITNFNSNNFNFNGKEEIEEIEENKSISSSLGKRKGKNQILKVSMDENTIIDLDPSSQIASFVWHLLQAARSNLKELDGQQEVTKDNSHDIGCIVSSVPASFLSKHKRILENALTIACTAEQEMKNIQKSDEEISINKKNEKTDEFQFPYIGLLTDGAAVAFTYGFDRRNEIKLEMKEASDHLKLIKKDSKTKDLKTNKIKETKDSKSLSATEISKQLSYTHLALGRTVMFVDFGYSCLQITIAKMDDLNAKVLSHVGDEEISGHFLDQLIFDLAVEKLILTGKWNSLKEQEGKGGSLLKGSDGSLTRAGVRLMEACMKAKVTLSANPTATIVVLI